MYHKKRCLAKSYRNTVDKVKRRKVCSSERPDEIQIQYVDCDSIYTPGTSHRSLLENRFQDILEFIKELVTETDGEATTCSSRVSEDSMNRQWSKKKISKPNALEQDTEINYQRFDDQGTRNDKPTTTETKFIKQGPEVQQIESQYDTVNLNANMRNTIILAYTFTSMLASQSIWMTIYQRAWMLASKSCVWMPTFQSFGCWHPNTCLGMYLTKVLIEKITSIERPIVLTRDAGNCCFEYKDITEVEKLKDMINTYYDKLTDCQETQNKSIYLFHLLGAMGFSVDEINVRKQEFQWMNDLPIKNKLWWISDIPLNDDEDYSLIFTGSQCEGLRGNSIIINEMPTDDDIILLYDRHYIEDGNEKEYSTIDPKLIRFTSKTINDPGILMEDDEYYPGYVKLFKVHQHNQDNQIKQYYSNRIYNIITEGQSDSVVDSYKSPVLNGPAITYEEHSDDKKFSFDLVPCFFFRGWPNVANEWLIRKRPNNWPLQETIDCVKSQGCLIAAVGHSDSDKEFEQWRMSFQGEAYLLSRLNNVQILCYVILKCILKTELIKIAENAITSFHVKNLILWCAEQFACKWESKNLLVCIKKCIVKLQLCVMTHHLPHYIIRERNLFTYRLTDDMSELVVKVLHRYVQNISNIFELSLIQTNEGIFPENITELEHETVVSVIISAFELSYSISGICHAHWTELLCSCLETDSKQTLRNCCKLLNFFSERRPIFSDSFVYLFGGIVQMLSNGKYSHTTTEQFFQNVMDTRNLNTSVVGFRSILLNSAVFSYMNNEYEDVIKTCLPYVNDEYVPYEGWFKLWTVRTLLIEKQLKSLNIDELYSVKKHILDRFFGSNKLNDTQIATAEKDNQNLISSADIRSSVHYIRSQIDNLPKHFWRYTYAGVYFFREEKWKVPDVLMYELLSEYSNIILSTRLCSLLLLFLSYSKTSNEQEMKNILEHIDFYLVDTPNKSMFEFFYCYLLQYSKKDVTKRVENTEKVRLVLEETHQAYNIAAYCNLKAQCYDKACRYVLLSLKMCASEHNVAFGYLRFIIGMLLQLADEMGYMTYIPFIPKSKCKID